jgi:two-component system, chemotaxis family, protein-glutamate methylesterase/glutaminase
MIAAPAQKSAIAPGPFAGEDARIRVMVVDDSVVVRGLMSRWIGQEPDMQVIAVHRGGRTAVEQLAQQKPDVIVLDIDMPDMDGLTALPLLLKGLPGVMVVIASTLTTRNAETTLRCLSLGAQDYVAKPATNRDVTFGLDFRREVLDKIRALGGRRTARSKAQRQSVAGTIEPASIQPPKILLRSAAVSRPNLLAIGASTGGPAAVLQFLQACRPNLGRFPTVICQHMPILFTKSFADSIRRQLSIDASEAHHGEPLEAGRIYVAPGGRHLRFFATEGDVRVHLSDDAPVNFCRPSVDVTFASAAQIYGRSTMGVMLTGMGSDGLQGSEALVAAGATVIAQDQDTSVIWGMPGAVARQGLCSLVAPVLDLAEFVNSAVRRDRP